MKYRNVSGLKSGLLTVLREVEKRPGSNRRRVLCRCECGVEKENFLENITSGNNKSCGCSRRQAWADNKYAVIVKHGEARDCAETPEYMTWARLRGRCLNPEHVSFKDYGGRGITICSRWTNSYSAFLEDMGRRPSAAHSIDRIDVNGNYEPNNCRWATKKEQARNRRNSKMLTAFGKTQCLSAWAEERGLTRDALNLRIRAGWPIETAISTPMLRTHLKEAA